VCLTTRKGSDQPLTVSITTAPKGDSATGTYEDMRVTGVLLILICLPIVYSPAVCMYTDFVYLFVQMELTM